MPQNIFFLLPITLSLEKMSVKNQNLRGTRISNHHIWQYPGISLVFWCWGSPETNGEGEYLSSQWVGGHRLFKDYFWLQINNKQIEIVCCRFLMQVIMMFNRTLAPSHGEAEPVIDLIGRPVKIVGQISRQMIGWGWVRFHCRKFFIASYILWNHWEVLYNDS